MALRLIVIACVALSGCEMADVALAEQALGEPASVPSAPTPPPSMLVVPAIGGLVRNGWTPDFGGYSALSDGCMRSTGQGRFLLLPQMREGDRLLALSVTMAGNLAADVTVTAVDYQARSNTEGVLAVLAVPNVSNVWSTYAVDVVDTVITRDNLLRIAVDADQVAACVAAIRLEYDRP